MRVLLENFDEKHIHLLTEMADALKFKVKKLDYPSSDVFNQDVISMAEEKEMTLVAMQASTQSLAELWDKEDDEYWNSYL